MINEHYTLHNGVKLPKIGLGTWQVPEGDVTYQAVRDALDVGYRHIDTAQGYGNEGSVGRAIEDSDVDRKDVFITTKLESHIKSYEATLDAFEASLKALKTDYVDLFLIHAPWPWNDIGKDCSEGNVQAFKAMEKLYREGKALAIGVSNFNEKDIQNILDNCEIVPHVNQIGCFVGHSEDAIRAFCEERNIQIEAYSPLAIGYALDNPLIKAIAKRYGKSPAQVCIRYCLEKNAAPLPKTTKKHRMVENADVDFKLDSADIEALDKIEDDPRQFNG
ncbi:MAG: aldo/keto reductase [Bacillota bacterium]